MKNNSIFFPSVLIIAVLVILIFSIHIPAQTGEPDEQIKLQMIAFVKQSQNEMDLSRPRIVYQPEIITPIVDQISYVKAFEVSKTESVSKILAFEQRAFEILNEKRLANGLAPLKWSEGVARIARLHSENMARFNFFSHTGLDGRMVNDRADSLGISDWRSIGENIAFNRGFKLPVESACEQWMQSPSHRENILDKKWKEAGIGAAIAPDGTYYFTEVFILK